jgi:hypothetical protein
MIKRDVLNFSGVKIGEMEFPDGTPEEIIALNLSVYAINPAKPMPKVVFDKIEEYEKLAPVMLREIKRDNTLAGITTTQSQEVFESFRDIIIALREGAFPTAYQMLTTKTPSGFVTQEMLDDWKKRILSYL